MSAKLVFDNIYRRCRVEPETLLAVALPCAFAGCARSANDLAKDEWQHEPRPASNAPCGFPDRRPGGAQPRAVAQPGASRALPFDRVLRRDRAHSRAWQV